MRTNLIVEHLQTVALLLDLTRDMSEMDDPRVPGALTLSMRFLDLMTTELENEVAAQERAEAYNPPDDKPGAGDENVDNPDIPF